MISGCKAKSVHLRHAYFFLSRFEKNEEWIYIHQELSHHETLKLDCLSKSNNFTINFHENNSLCHPQVVKIIRTI